MAHNSHVPYKAFDAGQEDDPYSYRPSMTKMQQAQADVDEVVVVMRNNMEKVLNRVPYNLLHCWYSFADTLSLGYLICCNCIGTGARC